MAQTPQSYFAPPRPAMGYTEGAISERDALALITIGTETGTLDNARALAAAYRAARPPMGPYWHPGDEV